MSLGWSGCGSLICVPHLGYVLRRTRSGPVRSHLRGCVGLPLATGDDGPGAGFTGEDRWAMVLVIALIMLLGEIDHLGRGVGLGDFAISLVFCEAIRSRQHK